MAKFDLSAKERKRIKYATIREQNLHKSLIVVDNGPIRAVEIRAAKALLKKIDKLDESIDQFHLTDRRLFSEWHDLTFRDLNERIAKKRDEYFSYADFHNQMVLLSKRKKISIPQAFRILREEEIEYEQGNESIRAKINEARARRKSDLEDEIRKASDANECDCPNCRRARRERQEFSDEPNDDDAFQLDPETRAKVEYLEKLDTDTIKKFLSKSHNSAMDFLLDAISLLMLAEREDLARRIWDLTPLGVKRDFNKFTKKGFGVSFDDMLSEYEEVSAGFNDREFDEELKLSNSGGHKTKNLSEEDRLKRKLIYRKIVRLIHPDRLNDRLLKVRKHWLESIWKKSVETNDLEDLAGLTKIYHQILIVLDEFDSLSVAELRAVVTTVQDEHSERNTEAKNMKSNPAWNFSKLKDYSKLKTKMSKPFHKEISNLDVQIGELQSNRAYLEQLMRSGLDLSPRRQPKKSKRRPVKRRRNNERNRSPSRTQMSFGF